MTFLTFLITIFVLGASMYGGYRYNMRLYRYTRIYGSIRSRRAVYAARESHDIALVQVRDYGLHIARTGLWVCAILVLVLTLLVMAFFFVVL